MRGHTSTQNSISKKKGRGSVWTFIPDMANLCRDTDWFLRQTKYSWGIMEPKTSVHQQYISKSFRWRNSPLLPLFPFSRSVISLFATNTMDETIDVDNKNKPADTFIVDSIDETSSEQKESISEDSLYYDQKEVQSGSLDQSSNDEYEISKVPSKFISMSFGSTRCLSNIDFSFENGSIYLSLLCKDSWVHYQARYTYVTVTTIKFRQTTLTSTKFNRYQLFWRFEVISKPLLLWWIQLSHCTFWR